MTPHGHARADHSSACDLSVLLSRSCAGDVGARETIILRFLPLARRVARIYEWRGEPIEDLCQVASIGLIKAVDGYEPELGDHFSAYARSMILGEIRRHFRDATWRVHVPRRVRERAWDVSRVDKELRAVSGSAKPEAIASYLGIAPGEVAEARRALEAYSPRSLDASCVAPGGDDLPLREAIGVDDSDYERAELAVGVRRVLLALRPRDQKVLLLRLAWGLSQREIARRVGLSQMQVSRILRKASTRLTASCGLVVGLDQSRVNVS